jgi:hypothetical protein
VIVTSILRNAVSLANTEAVAAAALPALAFDLATSAAVSRAATRASVRAWLQRADCHAAKASTINTGVRRTTESDVDPGSSMPRRAAALVVAVTLLVVMVLVVMVLVVTLFVVALFVVSRGRR